MEKNLYKISIFKRTISIVTALLLVVALVPEMVSKVHAATTLTASDWSTFQTALNNAADGDTIALTASFQGTTTPLNFVADGRRITIASSVYGTQRVVTQSNKDVRHLNILGTGIAGITFTDDVIFDGSTGGTSATANGGGVSVGSGTFNLMNGQIIDNQAMYGSGVSVNTLGVINMSGGQLTENSGETSSLGCGIYA